MKREHSSTVEHSAFNRSVAGSNPVVLIAKKKKSNLEINLQVLVSLNTDNQILLRNPSLLYFLRIFTSKPLQTNLTFPKPLRLGNSFRGGLKGKKLSTYSQVFTQWVHLNQIPLNSLRKPYNPRQLSYLLQSPHNLAYANLKSVLATWTNLLQLLKHLFFYESRGVFLTHPVLLKESTFLNWESLQCTWTFFKRFLPVFFSVNRSFNFKSLNVFHNSFDAKTDFVFIADNSYHKVNSLLFQKLNSFLITLHGEYENPWGSSFNLINMNKSLLTQYFFLKCCFWLKKAALQEKVLS